MNPSKSYMNNACLTHTNNELQPPQRVFWFATGGAGICLSRAMLKRLAPHVANGRFINIGRDIRLPDDVTLGYIIGVFSKGVLMTYQAMFVQSTCFEDVSAPCRACIRIWKACNLFTSINCLRLSRSHTRNLTTTRHAGQTQL